MEIFRGTEKHLTSEMTWGETANTQLRVKGKPLKESRCFALTSIELFGVSWGSRSLMV